MLDLGTIEDLAAKYGAKSNDGEKITNALTKAWETADYKTVDNKTAMEIFKQYLR